MAFDEIAFIETEKCEFTPDAAHPTTTAAPTTTVSTSTTTHHVQWHECDFENEDLCGWEVFPSPPDFPFQWERTNGKVLTDNGIEGPHFDHDDQNQSKY